MEKNDVVLVVLNGENLENAVDILNSEKVKLAAIFMDDSKEKTFGAEKIPINSFAKINTQIKKYKGFKWLINGDASSNAFHNMKRFLMINDVPEDNIFNTGISSQISTTWLANLKHIKEHGADFFATGNECTRDGLNLKYIPCVNLSNNDNGGVILADDYQDLRQSYLTAKHVFEHTKPGTIKFVLIGLTPDAFSYDNSKDFANSAKNLQYQIALNLDEENPLKDLTNTDVKNIFEMTTSEQADLNFEAVKKIVNGNFSIKVASDLNAASFSYSKPIEENIQILKDYIELCLANDAKPIGVVFPFAPVVRGIHSARLLRRFRRTIRQIEKSISFKCVDMFELYLNYDCFSDATHLNTRGTMHANAFLSLRLYEEGLIPIESFCDMTYEYFHFMSNVAPKDDYNALMNKVFKASAKMVQRKDKIKLGFVLYDTSMWSGDDLYNFFAKDEHFETTVFLCQRREGHKNEIVHKAFLRDIETFKSHDLNFVALETLKVNKTVPTQDVLIFLTPYFERVLKNFRPANLKVKTLMTHVIYSLAVSIRSIKFYNLPIFHTAWKIFLPTVVNLKMYSEGNIVGLPRGLYSGYPKLDIFFDQNIDFQFEWKMARPNVKKIIWAPHHSINEVTKWATFQWNYQFMYEFAKAHPEISWIVKPHPNLAFRAIDNKVFPSVEAFEEYLQKWNDLPNAQVYTGAYYQAIFATSDGMIHDCGSFTAEYQYVDKPMIYLTREGTKYNELGNTILKASYLVDGKDFDAIAAMIQRVFIEGDDYKAAERKEVYDKYLNYPKANGMLASEFIYHSIADELKNE